MLSHSDQKVAEAPREIGANDFALIEPDPRDGGRFGRGDGEMIGPEINQSFGEIRVGLKTMAGPSQNFFGGNLVERTQGHGNYRDLLRGAHVAGRGIHSFALGDQKRRQRLSDLWSAGQTRLI